MILRNMAMYAVLRSILDASDRAGYRRADWAACGLRHSDRPGDSGRRGGQGRVKGGTQQAYQGNMPVMLGGDLIVGMDGQEITSAQDLSAVMTSHRAGDVVTITIFRGRRKMDVQVKLGDAKNQTRGQRT